MWEAVSVSRALRIRLSRSTPGGVPRASFRRRSARCVFRQRPFVAKHERAVDLLNTDPSVLDRFEGLRVLHQAPGGLVGVGVRAIALRDEVSTPKGQPTGASNIQPVRSFAQWVSLRSGLNILARTTTTTSSPAAANTTML